MPGDMFINQCNKESFEERFVSTKSVNVVVRGMADDIKDAGAFYLKVEFVGAKPIEVNKFEDELERWRAYLEETVDIMDSEVLSSWEMEFLESLELQLEKMKMPTKAQQDKLQQIKLKLEGEDWNVR